MPELIAYKCDECGHVFSYEDVLLDQVDSRWGHPCFADVKGNIRTPGSFRCESYRACYQLTRIQSPISEDFWKGDT